jgi:sec-independent protein translocase protein TatA
MNFLRGFGLPELLILLVVIILLFGPGRISKVAEEIGKGIRSLREGINSNNNEEKKKEELQVPLKIGVICTWSAGKPT